MKPTLLKPLSLALLSLPFLLSSMSCTEADMASLTQQLGAMEVQQQPKQQQPVPAVTSGNYGTGSSWGKPTSQPTYKPTTTTNQVYRPSTPSKPKALAQYAPDSVNNRNIIFDGRCTKLESNGQGKHIKITTSLGGSSAKGIPVDCKMTRNWTDTSSASGFAKYTKSSSTSASLNLTVTGDNVRFYLNFDNNKSGTFTTSGFVSELGGEIKGRFILN